MKDGCGCGGGNHSGSTTSGPGAYSRHATGNTHAWNSADTKRHRNASMNAQHESDVKLNHVVPVYPSLVKR